jgi:bacillithiol synthase
VTRTRIPPAVPVALPGDGFAADWAASAPGALRWMPRHPSAAAAWTGRIGELQGVRVPPDVLARMRAHAVRLGADPATLATVDALSTPGTLCVCTGQQPALLLGPLFTLHKAWTAIELARGLEARTGRRTVPVFWSAGDDSDFAEIASTVLPDAEGRLARFALGGGELPAGGMVGDLGTDGTARALAEAESVVNGWPGGATLRSLAARALDRASDHGDLAAAWLYGMLPGTGLVVVDGRWPELRRAAAGLFERYADRREDVGRAVREAGRRLQDEGYRARITEASTEQALFDARDGRRLPFAGDDRTLAARARSEPETLSPNVLLRPLVQDVLFPNAATVAGPGEVAYHAQLAGAYARLEVGMPVLFPRFEATWVPEAVLELARRRDVPAAELVRDFDGTLRASSAASLSPALRAGLDALEVRLAEAAEGARRAAEDFDPSLADAAREMERRCREACERLRERAGAAARAAEARRDPSLRHYRELLRPRGIPQERVVSAALAALAGVPEGTADAVRDHVREVESGRVSHWLLPFRLPGGAA